ncbi:MAG: tetratricopeptide repeat protein [Deltaproteobacteria bacterium]|nr:tetratricopeptide repeat protein [Deltaproteobacteria bacterium]
MNILGTAGAGTVDALFSAVSPQHDRYEEMANHALSRGIDFYHQGNYEGAVKEFRRSIGLSPYSPYTANGYRYLVQSLLKLNRTDDALKAYRQAIKLDPINDSYHVQLGNLYFSLGRYEEAKAEYTEAVKIDSTSTLNRYSLGQAYLQTGQYTEAEQAFKTVNAHSPGEAAFALGQTYHRMGRYDDAVTELKSAVSLKKNLGYAYFELGSVYADQKEFEQAQEQVSILSSIDQMLALELGSYIYQRKHPKILSAYSTDFINTAGPGTRVSDLDPSLSEPNGSAYFTMHFIFSKPMDGSTVESPAYWSITKANGQNRGGVYNWGLPLAATEIYISPLPVSVVYHPNSQTADVIFKISQNGSGDGTLDPSHLVFKFKGLDIYGEAMDSAADEYSGISKIV